MKKQISVKELSNVDITGLNINELVDVSGFSFDNNIPQEKRAAAIVTMVKNPYCFRVGDMAVKLEFCENAPPLHELFTDFLTRKKSGI